MSTHVVIACPRCRKDLRARREYVGRQVSCKHCGHTFTIEDPASSGTDAAASQVEADEARDQAFSQTVEGLDAAASATSAQRASGGGSSDLLASLVSERDQLKESSRGYAASWNR